MESEPWKSLLGSGVWVAIALVIAEVVRRRLPSKAERATNESAFRDDLIERVQSLEKRDSEREIAIDAWRARYWETANKVSVLELQVSQQAAEIAYLTEQLAITTAACTSCPQNPKR